MLVALLPVYMENILGLSVTVVGFAFALQYLGDNLFRSPFGWVMERIGYRWTMTGALLLLVVAVGLIMYAKDAVSLSIACLILGIGTSPLWPCTMTGITELAGSTQSGSSGAAMGGGGGDGFAGRNRSRSDNCQLHDGSWRTGLPDGLPRADGLRCCCCSRGAVPALEDRRPCAARCPRDIGGGAAGAA
ncbi:MFS transporter [Paenibacillus rhizoplanae]